MGARTLHTTHRTHQRSPKLSGSVITFTAHHTTHPLHSMNGSMKGKKVTEIQRQLRKAKAQLAEIKRSNSSSTNDSTNETEFQHVDVPMCRCTPPTAMSLKKCAKTGAMTWSCEKCKHSKALDDEDCSQVSDMDAEETFTKSDLNRMRKADLIRMSKKHMVGGDLEAKCCAELREGLRPFATETERKRGPGFGSMNKIEMAAWLQEWSQTALRKDGPNSDLTIPNLLRQRRDVLLLNCKAVYKEGTQGVIPYPVADPTTRSRNKNKLTATTRIENINLEAVKTEVLDKCKAVVQE